MKQPMFSVIMPTYNRPAETLRAIRSVIGQSFGDWELIIVDDCSEEGTTDFLTADLLDSRVRIFSTEEQSGSPVVPRNLGVEKATGKWLAFLDSDDEWKSNKLKVVANILSYDALYYHDMRIGSRGEKNWSDLSRCYSGGNPDDPIFNRLLVKNFIPTSSVVIPRSLWHPMDERLKVSHDWDLWLEIARKYPVYFIPQLLGTLTLHEGSVITQTRRRRAESREVVRRHAPFCKFRWARWKAWWYYRLVCVYDYWRGILRSGQ